ncbi:hypothetical protein NGM33_20995 [Nocardiopsis dassonvillei]|uniref:hypothetical protein n=1 Tax=Nocardiopsis dassonvillei TaxID=2014 RepID=UPI00102BE57F|nr:hypothetical protein [Nocardiopsis dassonvillei]MCP3015809.1 hypothetical protein [Nocardiopsis dassonvillei]
MRRTVLTGAVLLLAATGCGEQLSVPDPPEATTAPETEQSPRGETAGPQEQASPRETQPTPEEDADQSSGAFVLNRYGNENGFDDQTPTEYVATEFTTFTDMEWGTWADEVARGEGGVKGTWCMQEGCQDDPYEVEVELGDPVDVDGTMYFSTYTITDHGEEMSEEMIGTLEEVDGGTLALPEPE